MINDKSICDEIIVGRVKPHIYAFTTQSVPNYLKVGDTYRLVTTRLDEWRKVYPDLKEEFQESAMIDENKFFRDYSVHKFLMENLEKERIDSKNDNHFSMEFFKDTSVLDVQSAISYIKESENEFDIYNALNLKPERTIYARNQDWKMRSIQQDVVDKFMKVYKKHNNLLLYAVMRFGKSFTAMNCAKQMKAKIVLIVSAKKDVVDEWQSTVEKPLCFEGYNFYTKKELKNNKNIIRETLEKNENAVLFFTLQDLQNKKDIHKELFDNKIDLMLIDETHFGARAKKYGKIIRNSKGINEVDKDNDDSSISYEKADEQIRNIEKNLSIGVKLHLSGTPYRILLSDEFNEDEIIGQYQYSDIIKEQIKWDNQELNSEKYEEWDNPYYGFPQMVRFAFTLNESSKKLLSNLNSRGIKTNLDELFRPLETKKINNDYKKFKHENEVLDFLKIIDGTKDDKNILGFLDYEKIKEGKMCNHIVMVLPFKASCDSMEELLINNKNNFKNLSDYEIINISGLNVKQKYNSIKKIKKSISSFELDDKKTITLTVNRMLTGSTVKEWDTMLFLKNTHSLQEYDQAIFRLQNPYIREVISFNNENQDIIKLNMKPQTLLVDFDLDRVFSFEEEKASLFNQSNNVRGNDYLKEKLENELKFSPIITINNDKMHEVNAIEVMDKIKNYSKDRGIFDEVQTIPADFKLFNSVEEIRNLILKQGELTGKNPFNLKYETDEDDSTNVDVDTDNDNTEENMNNNNPNSSNNNNQNTETPEEKIKKKFQTFYSRILFYSALTKTRVDCLNDIIKSLNNEDNLRILSNVGLSKNDIVIFHDKLNSEILKRLEYKVSIINQLSNDDSLGELERTNIALAKFNKISEAEVMTPQFMCDEIVGKYSDDYLLSLLNNGKILDLASKKGEFIVSFIKRYSDLNISKEKYKDLFYSIPTSNIAYEFTRKIYEILNLNIKNISSNFTSYDLIKVDDLNTLSKYISQRHDFSDIQLENNLFFKEGDDYMKFDIIVGNPPYQEADGGAGASAKPIYSDFVNISRELSKKYISLIIPSRWYVGGKGLDEFRLSMLNDSNIKEIDDCLTPDDIFPNTNNRGGVCYLLWDKDFDNTNTGVKVVSHRNNKVISEKNRKLDLFDNGLFIRDNESESILKKTTFVNDFKSLSDIVSSRKPFGLDGNFAKSKKVFDSRNNDADLECYIKGKKVKYISPSSVLNNEDWIGKWKVFIPRANNIGTELNDDNMNSFVGKPNSVCTESYIVVGAELNLSEEEAYNLMMYLQTKFARYLHSLLKASQDATSKTFELVPIVDFSSKSSINWKKSIKEIDNQLYKLYKLSVEEINHIEESIKEM